MTGREHQAQEIIAYVVVEGRIKIRCGPHSPGRQLVTEFGELTL